MNHLIEKYRYEPQWVLWKVEKVNDRLTKVPYTTSHTRASSTNPQHWATYDDVKDTLKRFRGSYSGIGIVFTQKKTLLGIDLDKVLKDGVIIDEKSARLVEIADTYCEISPSGTGLHLFLEITEPLTLERNRKKAGDFTCECYTENRYFTVPEQPFGESKPVRMATPDEAIELLKIVGYPWSKKQEPSDDLAYLDIGNDISDITIEPKTRINSTNDYHNDDDLLNMMFASKYGANIKSAYDGTLNNDLSANDYALIKHFAFFTGHDKQRSKTMFLASPSGQREKAKREDYFDRTWDAVIKALAGKKFEFTQKPPATPAAPKPDEGKTSQDERIEIDVTRESAFDDLLLNAHLNAAGNGDCFAENYKNRVIYEISAKKWLVFDDERWKDDESLQCNRYARETAQRRYGVGVKIADLERRKKFASFCIASETPAATEQTLKAASSVMGMQRSIKDFDTNKYLACAGDYTLDLTNHVAYGSKYDDYLTLKLGAKFIENADCPRWKQFINEIFDHNAELISYIKRALGYCLTGSTNENKIFLLYGDGANGKSLFLQITGHVMGDFATSMPFTVFDANERTNVQQELFNAKGKRFISVIETNQDRRLDEALIKNLTGKDEITGRRLFCEPVKFYPQFKIWLAMNHKPHIVGRDHGIWRRISLIPFNQNFTGKEERGLEEKLLSEASGILNWMLEGLAEYSRIGLNEPKIILDAVKQYRNEEDILQQWLADCANLTSLGKVQSSKAFQSFIAWAQSVNIKTSISMMKFSLMMAKAGFETATYTGRKFFQGIELVEAQ